MESATRQNGFSNVETRIQELRISLKRRYGTSLVLLLKASIPTPLSVTAEAFGTFGSWLPVTNFLGYGESYGGMVHA